jgi:hypothetical protein
MNMSDAELAEHLQVEEHYQNESKISKHHASSIARVYRPQPNYSTNTHHASCHPLNRPVHLEMSSDDFGPEHYEVCRY